MSKNLLISIILLSIISGIIIAGCGSGGTGQITVPPTVTSTTVPELVNIKGQALEVNGIPIPNAFVVCVNPGLSASLSAIADTLGNYLFKNLPPGNYRIEIWRSEGDHNSSPGSPIGAVNITVTEGTVTVNVMAGTIDPTATPTVTPAVTNTPTATNTPAGGSTATITPGGPTNTPAATNTPGGPTNTPTATNTPNPWSTGVRVDDSIETNSATGAKISVDPSGNAYAVWTDNRNGNSDIYFSYRPSGGNWGTNVRVDDATGTTGAEGPDIAVDSSGNAYAVWVDRRNGKNNIYFSYRPSGGSWGASEQLGDALLPVDQGPDIAVDLSGNAYAVWPDRRNGNSDTYFSYRPSGGNWGANVRVDDASGTTPVYDTRIAVDSSGNAYAVWADDRNGGSYFDIYFSYRPSGGNWGTNVRINDVIGFYCGVEGGPDISVDSSGNAYVVSSSLDIYFYYRPSGGSWGTYETVNDTYKGFYPGIAVDSPGNAYTVWMYESVSIEHYIYFSYRPSGGSWGTGERVSDLGDGWYPCVSADSSGRVYAIWQESKNGNEHIYFSIRE